MAVSATALTDALAGIVGSEHLSTDPVSVERHAVDGVRPCWIALPTSIEELTRLLCLASEEHLAVVPYGTGARIGVGNLPARADLVIGMSRLSGLVEYRLEP